MLLKRCWRDSEEAVNKTVNSTTQDLGLGPKLSSAVFLCVRGVRVVLGAPPFASVLVGGGHLGGEAIIRPSERACHLSYQQAPETC